MYLQSFNKHASIIIYSHVLCVCFFRKCIGQRFAMMELQVVSATVLRSLFLEVDDSKPVVPFPSIVLRAKGGLWLKIKPIGHMTD